MSPLQTTQTPQAAKPPELLRLKEHLISLISRELEMRSPPMNERRDIKGCDYRCPIRCEISSSMRLWMT